MFKNVAGKVALFAFNTTTGAPVAGDAGNITAYVSKDYGTVTVLADTSATEMDATNAKGWYLFDVAQAESNADALLFTGKSSTANISIVGQYIFTTPNRFTTLVIDAAGLADANAVKVGPSGSGTAQTARDVGASVLVAGDFTATMKTSIGTAVAASPVASVTGAVGSVTGLTASDVGAIKAKTDNLTATPADETLIISATNAIMSRLGAPAGASVSADVAAVKGDTGAVKTQTDKLAFTITNQVDANVIDWKSTTAPAMTGDAFARLGAPSGSSVSTDIAAVLAKTPDSVHFTAARGDKLDDLDATVSSRLATGGYTAPDNTSVAAVKTVTDKLATAIELNTGNYRFTTAALAEAPIGTGSTDVNVVSIAGNTNAATNLERGCIGTVLGTVGTGSTTTSIVTSALDPAASVIDQFKGRIVTFDRATTTVNLRGQTTDVTSSSSGGVLAVSALSTAPVSSDTFTLT